MQAIVSDIHANLEAFQAVLEDISKLDVSSVVCLGDVIGYGPSPLGCIDLARLFRFTLLGNHEDALLFRATGFNEKAKKAIEWTRSLLNSPAESEDKKRWRWNFLGGLKSSVEDEDILYVHGSPREPIREYLFPSDVTDKAKMGLVFDKVKSLCFVGHSHVAGIFTGRGYILPVLGRKMDIKGLGKVIVNAGSVGQPRDGDKRACYVLHEKDWVMFRRVDYNVEATIAKIEKVPALDAYLAQRLRTGT